MILRGILFSVIPVISIYFIKESYGIMGFLLIGGMSILRCFN